MTIMSSGKQYSIVNGAQLPSFMGKNVSVIGVVAKYASAGSLSLTINTTDNIALTVNLNKPLDKDLNGEYIEVRGVCENAREGKIIKAEEYFSFNNTSFDAKSHNTLCKFVNSIPNGYSAKKN
ncbi:hypothetical protein Zmor_025559 [Zophobas morio]|uniref:Replication protein A 14 kDa subunit n=1 Tax=Zophobas morio TaxID=2755281 RepID=A0AA38HTH0_9CUCU|nr:hypothetical protein Zmor_025559 [Zophobas morio]